MAKNIKRRTCIKRCAGLAAAASLAQTGNEGCSHAGDLSDNGLNVYFGDLHNHNSVGYGLGSPERAFEIARSHLDFFCFTPHAYFDTSPQNELMKTWKGYEKITHDRWPEVLELNKRYHEPGTFVTFPGYERHSSIVGHYCIIFPFDDAPLKYYSELKDFQNHALENDAIIVPHHPGYREGTSGAESEYWDTRVSPILEMFSEHGNAECDTAPVDYIRHSMGPRLTRHTMQAYLAQGHRFGIVASTDDHLGFPGAYGEGKAVVLAPELTRESVFGALKKRRCYGVSGDKIVLDFRVNGKLMGESIPYSKKRTISASVKGWDWIDRVEVLKNNRVIHREMPSEPEISPRLLDKPFLVKVEYGWGPMAENQIPLDRIPQIYDWDYTLSFAGANITELQPCYQSAPLAEEKRHRITGQSTSGFSLSSYTSRQRCLFNRDTHSIVMRVNGSPSDVLSIDFRAPDKDRLSVKLSDILIGDESLKIKSNSLKIHRIVPETCTKASFTIHDSGSGDSTDWYYVRVVQKNGQLAWSSPIWVEKRG
ncbi:hypothetical protein ACFL30_03945 [Candidatus Latescibacterota bacterium]